MKGHKQPATVKFRFNNVRLKAHLGNVCVRCVLSVYILMCLFFKILAQIITGASINLQDDGSFICADEFRLEWRVKREDHRIGITVF